MSSKNDMKLGLFIICAGLFILLGKLGVFGFLGRALWPLLLLIPGLILHVFVFGRRLSPAALIPAGIMTVYGLLFGLCNTFGWWMMAYLWPVLLLGIAVGLYEYSLYASPRSGGLTVGSAVLGIVSLLLMFLGVLGSGFIYIVGAVLIVAGIWLMLGRGGRRGRYRRGW
ncbi:hypothetical protein D3C81_274040 [compost metagenome]|uniref:DUF5668 domain-containing protein n=1 Tax=Paenibacillus stellifer TaxID=169760 RepID=A0A089N888_9BACL|nr:hypothetical protein [Paenibacillus stellifer]AIQ64989.1 hypothetical protein PSTEL_19605 [Paenibacillus stellifer]